MVFDPKTVFGLCNVLNRHSKHINLKISFDDSSQHQIEQWAKRMDLVYRDSVTKFHSVVKEPRRVLENLESIEKLSSDLVFELYDVDPSIEKQLSIGLEQGEFVQFRSHIRDQVEFLKAAVRTVNALFENKSYLTLLPESIAALDAAIDVWKSSEKNRKIPRRLKSNIKLKSFIIDCFKVFNITCDPDDSYESWYKLNHKRNIGGVDS